MFIGTLYAYLRGILVVYFMRKKRNSSELIEITLQQMYNWRAATIIQMETDRTFFYPVEHE